MKRQQCKTCPWKKGARCANIPNYNLELHESLAETIADNDGNISKLGQPPRIMGCHYSSETNQIMCVGWLENQLGRGNNFPLRIWFHRNYPEDEIETHGKQKDSFEETFQ
jgi:hypothetical protein